MTSELKPCPFCGGEAKLKGGRLSQENYTVWCENLHKGSANSSKEKAIAEWNTRAVPDVPELVRYSAIELVRSIDAGYDPLPSDDGDYVEFSQAAEIIAAKDREIERLKSDRMYVVGVNDGYKSAEAKLAQYEAQEPIGYISARTLHMRNEGLSENIPIRSRKTKNVTVAVYTSPAPAADLKADLERKDAALRFYADISKYPAPLTGGMGALWGDCGQIARAALNVEASNDK